MQGSPTFGLADDCFRFVIRHFEIIKTSSQHIYHSALLLTPRESIVQKLYKSYAQPFARVVRGLPAVWDSNTAAATSRFQPSLAVWSPCNRFIAIAPNNLLEVDILDSTTLQRLRILEFPPQIPPGPTRLAFSPDGRMLTSLIYNWSASARCERAFVLSWDLQTGGIASLIERKQPPFSEGSGRITYSRNGKVVAVLNRLRFTTNLSIYDVVSGLYMHDINHGARTNPDHPLGAPYVYEIWTHGDSIRFATPGMTAITIWEVGFDPKAAPMEVERLSVPDKVVRDLAFPSKTQLKVMQTEFHPALCRLAFYGQVRNDNTLLIWDARASKFLLHLPGAVKYCPMKFSPDGRSFACTSREFGVCLWRESPTGYALFERLAPTTSSSSPYFTPNGESIITLDYSVIRLWRTGGSAAATSSVPVRALQHKHTGMEFILEFLPDRPFAVTARRSDETVTVLDLKSGTPQLTIDTSIEVHGLRPIGNSIVIISDEGAITWNLSGGDLLPDSKMDIGDSTRTINLINMGINHPYAATISLDSQYIALLTYDKEGRVLHVYCTSTGRTMYGRVKAFWLWFTPDGHEIWCVSGAGDGAEVFTITQDTLNHTRTIADIADGSLGCPWGSSHGYKVTTDGWVLRGDGKRLLMLPPLWRSAKKVERVWHEKFLALLHGDLPDPVILELEP